MKVIYVEWIDAVAEAGWTKFREVSEVHHCRTVGYLVKETENSLVLAGTISEDECNGSMTIPKKWIKRRKVVKL